MRYAAPIPDRERDSGHPATDGTTLISEDDETAVPGVTKDNVPFTHGSYARTHPLAISVLAFVMAAGGVAGYVGFAEHLSPIRSVLGGAVSGFGCWLLVMIGRVIDE
ncbi:MAG: hypothetical protein ACI9QQ_000721 [Myxococcota bacterium]